MQCNQERERKKNMFNYKFSPMNDKIQFGRVKKCFSCVPCFGYPSSGG